jgi:hypothetical protein
MHHRTRSLATLSVALAFFATTSAACTYWYAVDESHAGPDFELSVEEPEREFVLRACVMGAHAEDMAISVIARARMEDPVLEDPAELALTLAAPGNWVEPSESASMVAATGTTSLVEGTRVELEGMGALCSDGLLVHFERLDPALAGRVLVEWTAYASAGSPNTDIEGARLVLEAD